MPDKLGTQKIPEKQTFMHKAEQINHRQNGKNNKNK